MYIFKKRLNWRVEEDELSVELHSKNLFILVHFFHSPSNRLWSKSKMYFHLLRKREFDCYEFKQENERNMMEEEQTSSIKHILKEKKRKISIRNCEIEWLQCGGGLRRKMLRQLLEKKSFFSTRFSALHSFFYDSINNLSCQKFCLWKCWAFIESV